MSIVKTPFETTNLDEIKSIIREEVEKILAKQKISYSDSIHKAHFKQSNPYERLKKDIMTDLLNGVTGNKFQETLQNNITSKIIKSILREF